MIKLEGMKEVEEGIYYDVPHEEYRKWNCFSYSMVKSTLVSQKELYHYLTKQRKETDQMLFGNILETILLEPQLFDDMYVVAPQNYLTPTGKLKDTKDSRPWLELQKSKGKKVITPSLYDSVLKCKDGIMQNPEAFNAMQDTKTQVSIVWVDSDTNVKCKARLDILKEGEIIDLKTTDDITPYKWSKKIYDFLYHVQAAMYCDGYQQVTKGSMLPYSFIAAQNREPYDAVLYELDESSIIVGRETYKEAQRKYKAYQETDIITGYSSVREPITIPLWALKTQDLDHEVI